MKKSIIILSLLVLTLFACQENEEINPISSNNEVYPETFTIHNWKEFVSAPLEVMDEMTNKLEAKSGITPNLNAFTTTLSSASFADTPVAIRQFGNVSVIELTGALRPLGNTLVTNERDSAVTSFVPFPGGNNFSITPPLRTSCFFHQQNSQGNFSSSEWESGVNVLDLIRIINHIGGNDPFDQLWQFLAADADGNSIVDLNDVQTLADLIGGTISELPSAQPLPQIERIFQLNQPVFYVERNTYNKAQADLANFLPNIRTLYAHFTCQSNGSINRIAIKRGDLNRSWNLVD